MRKLLSRIAILSLLIVGASAVVITASSSEPMAAQEPLPSLDSAIAQQGPLLDQIFDDTGFQGSFVGNGPFSTVGDVTVFTDDIGNRILRLSDDFQTERGGQLDLILRADSGAIENLGGLQRLTGIQDYLLPDQIDLNNFNQVQVWDGQLNTDRANAFLSPA